MNHTLTIARFVSALISRAYLLSAALSVFALLHSSAADNPAPIRTRYLLLDARIVDKATGLRLVLGPVQKYPGNPLFKEDLPWEVRFDNLYPNVTLDIRDGIYRCWYSPFIVDTAVSATPSEQRGQVRYQPREREMGICHAASRDGIHWEKPHLGLVEFAGSKANNLVLKGPHGAGVFFDSADIDPARRYKMICRTSDSDVTLSVAFSPDGVHWSDLHRCPEIKAVGDAHNNAFWMPEANKYAAITRLKTASGERLVARTESRDFMHWTQAVEVLRGDSQNQAYAMPVFRHAGLYLGLLMIFTPADDRVHCELAWSPDSVEWHRINPGTPFIPNSQKRGDYDWGCVYAGASPIVLSDEIRLYYGASNGPHTTWRDGFLALATLRPDGFAGYEPVARETSGQVLTRPLRCAGGALRISADAAGGQVMVRLLNEAGKLLATAAPVTGNVTDQPLHWGGKFKLATVSDQPVRLEFELTAACLYSFSFGEQTVP